MEFWGNLPVVAVVNHTLPGGFSVKSGKDELSAFLQANAEKLQEMSPIGILRRIRKAPRKGCVVAAL